MTNEEGKLLDKYIEQFDDCYPTMILGLDVDMIKRCLELNVKADVLYADKIKNNVKY